MPVRVVARGLRIDSNSPATEVALPPSSGGSRFKRVMYCIKRIDASASTDDLTLKIQHGPDGNLWATHTDYPALADIGDLMTFESDADAILGEYFRAVIKTDASAGQWFVVDVFEVTNDF